MSWWDDGSIPSPAGWEEWGRLDSGDEDDGDINDWERHLETIVAFSFFFAGGGRDFL